MPSSTALAKRSAESALMPPPPAPKKIKRPMQALDEEQYEDALSQIIKRDFFPGLAETDSQKDYLAALESEDPVWIAEAGQKLKAVTTPGPEGRVARSDHNTSWTPISGLHATADDTPRGWVGDTPRPDRDAKGKGEVSGEGGTADTGMGLGDFQARYTSEDNESFYKLLDRSNQKKSEKYAWLRANNNKIPTNRELEWKTREDKLLMDKALETAENGGKELIAMDNTDRRKAGPEAWRAKPKNGFMFFPESVEDDLETVQQHSEAKSKMGPKEIVYENTRMPPPPRPRTNVPASPSLSAVRDAIAGRPRLSGSEIAPSDSGAGGETPRVNGYAFVDSEEPEPESVYYATSQIDLGPGDATNNPFKIRESGGREALHHRMVDKLNQKKTNKQREITRTPLTDGKVGRSSGSRRAMTPAAQKLFGMIGSDTPQSSSGIGQDWGLTPRSKPSLAGITPVKKR